MKRPITTLLMLMSVDGKINSGDSDALDPDRDWARIIGVREGLAQYYQLEQNTDLFSLNTGRVMAKIGINERESAPSKTPCSFVIIDNRPHLKESGIRYLCEWCKTLYLVTTNHNHPAYNLAKTLPNLEIMSYRTLRLPILLEDLVERYQVERLTIQSGGQLNGLFLRENLIDYLQIVVAPLLVGGKDTPTLIDGESITLPGELSQLKALRLMECRPLDSSYVELKYQVIKQTELV